MTPTSPSDLERVESRFRLWRHAEAWTFVAVAAVLLAIMVIASRDFGVTWDEKDRHKNGELIWAFIRGYRGRSAFSETGGHLYPGLFDTICAAIESWVPLNRYVLRHAVNAVFGWIGAVYCGRLAGRFYGRWFGTLAMVLLALSPRYFADSMNNPKDLPFAAMTIVALYYISTVSAKWPYVSASTAIKIAVALGLALNIRVGALLYLGYFGLLIGILVVRDRNTDWLRLASTAACVAAVALAMLFLGTLFWPWAGAAPLTRPFQALMDAANYPWGGLVLFRGHEYTAEALPWYYAPWWLAISTPPVVLVGVVLSVMFVFGRDDVLRRVGLLTVVVLPTVAAIVMHSTLYDGIRHLEFIYPPLVVLAVSGWAGALAGSLPLAARRGAALALAAGLAGVLVFNVRFHPNQGTYFNWLGGGPRKAFAYYDMDHWGNCTLQAVKWAADVARSKGVVITVSGNPQHLVQLNAERFHEVAFTHPARNRHYFDIRLARGPAEAVEQLARQPALHQVRTSDGAVLCTVTTGPAYGELDALQHPAVPQAHHQPNPQ